MFKSLIYIFWIFLVNILLGQTYYVDKNASGSNNGTSWSNAWQNLSNVQWSTLGAGDTLFISGGTSSTIYNETLTIGASGNANGLLVVTKGRTTGHNGEVILDGGNTGFGIYVQNDQYVKVSDLTIRNMDLGARILDPANVIRIENCNMYNLHGGGIDISGYNGTYNTDQVDSVFIVNCSVVSHETNGNQTDGIDIAYCQNIFITDSYVSVDNVGEAHTDIIQTYQIAKNVTLKRNRLENLIDKTINPSSGANGLMMDKLVGTITIDNNVLRTPNFNAGAGICAALFAYSQSDPPLVYFYNNTCIWDNATNAFSFGSSSYPVASGSKYKNNIFYSTGLTGGADPVNFGPNSSCSNVSNNIFYSSAGSWSGGSNCSSPHANPMFTNPGSDWTLQGGSPAIDAGIDLGSEYQKDRAGNLRTGTWDLGAYELSSGGGNYIFIYPGWNYVSIPKLSTDMSAGFLFPTAISPVYSYNSNYQIVDTLQNGIGYIVKFGYPQTIFINGASVASSIQVVRGWNLIGPFDRNILVSNINSNPPGIISSAFFEFDGRTFIPSNVLAVGKGYWVKANENGVLDFETIKNFKGDIVKDSFKVDDSIGKIKIIDASGQYSILYISRDKSSFFELPPIPPDGIFDARYSSGKFVEDLSEPKEILIRTNYYPVILTVEGIDLKISDRINGKLINNLLKEGGKLVIKDPRITSIDISSKAKEKNDVHFELFQNYPNPFNSVTTIDFSVLNKSYVTLSVFNVLGEKVNQLINKSMEKGYYKVEFNAPDLPSGVYFYRLNVIEYSGNAQNNFNEIKKMVLLK